ncbi:MAG: alpha/beta fold hydrolase [Vicinamibacterales bacterium]|nr:alpha/beta fold hydrolase [Vicinamibacterales bacterium]
MPAVVFLHAFPLTHQMWRPQVAALPPGWTALTPDFRGFGDAPPDAGGTVRDVQASLDDYAADVVNHMDAAGMDRAVFCGCSMGGYTALALLRRYPARVAGLVLADTKASADTEQARVSRRAMLELLDREGPSAVTASMLPRLIGPSTKANRPAVMPAVSALAARATQSGIGHAVVRMLNRPDASAELAVFRGPVLIVVGEEDELTPVSESEAMHALVPGSRLVVIPGAGHLSNLEAPQAFNAALAGFLTERLVHVPEPRLSAEASAQAEAPSPEPRDVP